MGREGPAALGKYAKGKGRSGLRPGLEVAPRKGAVADRVTRLCKSGRRLEKGIS
jgi:hypothetical protein